jgi:hypothetical protein
VNPGDFEICAYCPNLCRHVCPVAVASGHEAATPTAMMTVSLLHLRGQVTGQQAGTAASLCVSCGACTEHCRLHRPVSDLLTELRRATMTAQPPAPLEPIQGEGHAVAVECGTRPWARTLQQRFDEPVARWVTADHLGSHCLDHPDLFETHAERLREALGRRLLVVACHQCLEVAKQSSLSVVHLAQLVQPPKQTHCFSPCGGPQLDLPSASRRPLCCGRHPNLAENPDIAEHIASTTARFLTQGDLPHQTRTAVSVPDAACATRLRHHGAQVTDPIDWLERDQTPIPNLAEPEAPWLR